MDDTGDTESFSRVLEQTRRIPETIPNAKSKELDGDNDDDLMDEEQLKRILACKRLSEGNCGQHLQQQRLTTSATAANHHMGSICRKNSLHIIGESLPPVTEGVPVRNHHNHLHHHLSSVNMGADQPVGGSGSLRSKAAQLAGKRNSQDDNTTASCSSSNSLDGSGSSGGGLSRRRSSTVSQCSSVLSEGTRQQLNFDLSPDLPPDSSIHEANAISPVDDFERPASPEPSSEPLDSNEECSFDMRPISRMSGTFCSSGAGDDELMLTPDSPEPALGHDSSIEITNQLAVDLDSKQDEQQEQDNSSEQQQQRQHSHECSSNIRENLERIISHVSTVRVGDSIVREPHEEAGASLAGQKRAHTPFGLNIQRNKTTHMSPATPSPTAHLSETAQVSAI